MKRTIHSRPLLSGALSVLLLGCSGGKFESVPDSGSEGETSAAESDDNSSDTTDEAQLPSDTDASPAPQADGAAPAADDSSSDDATDGDEPSKDDTTGNPSPDDATSDDAITDDATFDDTGAPTKDDDATDPATGLPDGGATDVPGSSDASDTSVTTDESTTTDETDASSTTEPTSNPGDDCSLGSNLCLDAGSIPSPTDTLDASLPTDECPEIADQLVRGSCGCGFDSDPLCEDLEEHIVHRYSFDGTGKQVSDSVGGADGEAVDVELDGSGELELDGNSQHVVLPSGVGSESSSASFEAWVVWHGGDNNQRVFNFGTPVQNEAPQQFISLTPSSGNNSTMAVSVRTGNSDSGTLRADWALPTGSVQHLTTVFDGDASEVRLYVGQELVGILDNAFTLQDLADDVNYLGRALYDVYPNFDGSLLEFRIYDIALDLQQVSKSDALGESATFSAAP